MAVCGERWDLYLECDYCGKAYSDDDYDYDDSDELRADACNDGWIAGDEYEDAGQTAVFDFCCREHEQLFYSEG